MTRLLLLSVSAGNGHVRAAQALQATAQLTLPADQVVHLDAMQFVASGFRKLYTDGYLKLVSRYPEMWSYLHQKTDETPHTAPSQRLRRAMERLSSGTLLKQVRQHAPQAVLCTHFLPAELLLRERRQGRVACPLWLQVTDYDLHNMWLVPEMDGYFAATEEVAHRMRERGLPAERIHVTGIPVMPAFSQPDDPALAREACARQLGLDPARRTVLVVSGGAGVGDLASLVGGLLALPGDFQLIAVAGRNQAAKDTLDALVPACAGRLLAIGFTHEMQRLMAAADLVVSKPGGLTISECMALGKPMLLVSPIPGQEEHNAGYLMEQGAAWLAYDTIGLHYKLPQLMNRPDQLAAMAARSRALGRPDAAAAVLRRVMEPVGEPLVSPTRRALAAYVAWVGVMAIFFALVEIQIEGGAGWAASLPTWRVAGHWALDLFWGGREMTGYHAWVFSFMALVFFSPLAFSGRWTWRAAAQALAGLMLFWVVEDFAWFLLNPDYGWARFDPAHIAWHKRWWWGAPVDYWWGTAGSLALFAWVARGPRREGA